MNNLFPLKTSFSKNPALSSLIDFNIDAAQLVCHLLFVTDTYKVYHDNKRFLIYYYVSSETGHQYKYTSSFNDAMKLIEELLREVSVACVLDSYEAEWWVDLPLWLFTEPQFIKDKYQEIFKTILLEKELILNAKMAPEYDENYVLNKWQVFLRSPPQ